MRHGKENAPGNFSWLRQRRKPLETICSRSGLTTQIGKRVKFTLPASGGVSTS